MHDQAKVLQQRVQVGALGGNPRHESLERTAGAQQEQEKPGVQEPERAKHTAVDFYRETAPPDAHRPGPGRHDRRPEEEGAFVGTPGRTHPGSTRGRSVFEFSAT